MFEPWQVFALGMSFTWAGYLLVNQHYRISARLLCLWRGFLPMLVFGGLLTLRGWPTEPGFYLVAVTTGLLIGVFDRWLFMTTALHGSGPVARLLVLGTPVSFILWTAITPGHLHELVEKPLAPLIPLALLGMVLSVMKMRADHVSRGVLLAVLPLIAGAGVIDVLMKVMFTQSHGLPAYMAYGAVSGACVLAVNLVWRDRHAPRFLPPQLFAPRVVMGGVMASLILIVGQLLKPPAMEGTPNPAFVAALGLLAPVWVMAWNRLSQTRDRGNAFAGAASIAFALLLLVASA